MFRKTCATILDESELSARQIADQLGHAKVSMTQDNYLGRRLTDRRTAEALDVAVGRVECPQTMDKSCVDLEGDAEQAD